MWSQCMVLVTLAPPSTVCGRIRGKESDVYRCLMGFHQQVCMSVATIICTYVYTNMYTHTRMDRGYGSQSVVPSGGKKSAAALLLKR